MNKNRAALAYGALLAGVFASLILGIDRIIGTAVFSLLVGGHLLATGWMPWKRLGMLLTSVGMYGAGFSLVLLGVLGVQQHRDLVSVSPAFLLPLLLVLLVGPILLWIDRKRHPEAWKRWRHGLRKAPLRDLVRGRHYPGV